MREDREDSDYTQAVDACARYIWQSDEEKDFLRGDQEPSPHHVYYSAYLVLFGVKQADKMLRIARMVWKRDYA